MQKFLITTACFAVIISAGVYLWDQFSTYREKASIQASNDAARQELFDLARAQHYEPEKVRTYCRSSSDRRYNQNDNSEFVAIISRNCSAFGFN